MSDNHGNPDHDPDAFLRAITDQQPDQPIMIPLPRHLMEHPEVCVTTDAEALARRIFENLNLQTEAYGGSTQSRTGNADDVVLDGYFNLTMAVRTGLGLPPTK